MTPHSLRHSLATELAVRQGLSPRQLQLVLRHSSVTTQRLYVHAEPEILADLLAGFDYSACQRG
jgi:site-specific recombinase XerD